jgi:hypothetical protein
MDAEPQEKWTVRQCAEYHGVQPATWRSYVSRRDRTGAPAPAGHYDARTPYWDAAEVRGWERPGPGARTDLHRAEQLPRPGDQAP